MALKWTRCGPQRLKPRVIVAAFGTTRVVPFPVLRAVPTGLVSLFIVYPALTRWAAFFRRFAAAPRRSIRDWEMDANTPTSPTIREKRGTRACGGAARSCFCSLGCVRSITDFLWGEFLFWNICPKIRFWMQVASGGAACEGGVFCGVGISEDGEWVEVGGG